MVEHEDTGDRRSVKDKTTKAKLARSNELSDLNKILGLREGRNFIWRTLSQAGVYSSSFTGDALETAFNEGRRSMGLWSLAEIFEADPLAYGKMRQEAQDEQKKKGNLNG